MTNLLRSESYKLFKSKCFYICCIVMIGFAFLMYGLFALANMAQNMQSENVTVTVDGISVWEEMSVPVMAGMLFSASGMIIVAIFVAIFWFGDYSNGAIKNIVGKGYSRITVFAAKYAVSVIGAILIELAVFGGLILCETVFLKGERLTPVMWSVLGKYVGVQLVLSFALTGIMVLINQICRNLGLGIAVGICLVTFSSFITMAINALLSYLKVELNVCDYWIIDIISNCPVEGLESSFVIRAVVCTVAWCALTFALGGLHFHKVDVK